MFGTLRTHVPSTGSPPPGHLPRGGRRRPAIRRRGQVDALPGEADGHPLVDRGRPLRGRSPGRDLEAPASQPPPRDDARARAAARLALITVTSWSALAGRATES